MSCDNPIDTRRTAKGRFLDMFINMAGAWKANQNYTLLSGRSDYESDLKITYPYAPDFEGTASGTDFTPTVSPVWTVDELADKYAIFFVKADLDALTGSGDTLNQIAGLDYQVQKIVSNTATAVTVGANVGAYTGMIVMDSAWWKFGQINDFTFEDTANQITANDSDSGGYSVSVDGLRNADVTGVTGNYFVGLHTHFQLQKTKEIGCTMKVRHGASDNLHESVYKQLVSVNQFSQAGTLEGDTIATYSGNLINKGKTVEIEAIMTEGVVPDFL